MHKFHPSIFREYDIRGIYSKTLFDADAYQIGFNYGMRTTGRVAVGFDGRLSSHALCNALINGLTDAGINVINIGLVPTPALYFSVFHLNLDGGIMITGSHNPADHNGFKIMLGKESLYGSQISSLANNYNNTIPKPCGKQITTNIKNEYLNKITENFQFYKNLRIAYDAGNGASGEVIEMLAPKLTSEYYFLNTKIDGNFPSHHPDPTVEENLTQLKEIVLSKKLDVGFAFDGDGDRIGIIDNKGRVIWGDQILAILCKTIAIKHPNTAVVVDVKTSQAVINYIKSIGLNPVIWKTGHSLIKSKMKELDSMLSGEMSAHIFFKDNYFGYDDGILAAVRFVQVMQKFNKTSSELLDELPKMISSPEIKIAIDDNKKFEFIEQIKQRLISEQKTFSDIDGVRVQYDYGWWLARASNTGGNIICRFEADTQKNYLLIEKELKEFV